MSHGAAASQAAPSSRYDKDAAIGIRGDEWFRSHDDRTRVAAEAGSKLLLNAIERMFRRFEIDNGFVEGAGKELLNRGWHA